MITFASFLTLVLIGIVFVSIEYNKAKGELRSNLSIMARVIAGQSTAAVIFSDNSSAEEILSGLKVEPTITAAAIFSADKRLFAKYESGIERQYDFENFKQQSETSFVNNKLLIYEPIVMNEDVVGTLFIVASLKGINQMWLNLLFLTALMISIGSFVSFILASWLQRFISEPILVLTKTAEKVALSKDYSLRVDQKSEDEVGQLVHAFNSMLEFIEEQNKVLMQTNSQLEQSQDELKNVNEVLEKRVEERTAELEESNEKLKIIADELKEEKVNAEKSNVAKSHFLANMSHEIRTPINAIMGMHYLLEKTSLNTQQTDYVMKAQSAASSLLNIINDILDFSKIESGKLDIEHIPFNLDKVLDTLKNIVEVQAKAKNLNFSVLVDKELPKLFKGDPHRLEQVLINLCNNAIKFTNNGSVTLRIECVQKGSEQLQLRFCVQDSGIGMSEEQREKIFEEFSQADSSTTRKFGGTGLGLSICSRLVNLMGGELWLESSTKGVGSTFCFEIPLDNVSDFDAAELTQELDKSGILKNLSVLIVDDNEAARNVLLENCELLGLRRDAVSSGEEALSAIEEGDYDIVFLDWKMADLDGLETTKRIHTLKGLKKVPRIFIVTAYNREDIYYEFKDSKIEAILVKPVRSSDILNALMSNKELSDVMRKRKDRSISLESIQEKKILVAEDNDINLMFITDLLGQEGLVIESARNGYEAVEKAKAFKFDLILMDVQMPELDGNEATKLIRQLESVLNDDYYAKLPIIGLSANVRQHDIDKSLEAGMNAYLFKPIDPEMLFETLLDFLGTEKTNTEKSDIKQSDVAKERKSLYDYSSLHGIDQDIALKRVVHNEDLLLKLLRKFEQHQSDSFKVVMELIAQNSIEEAEKKLHQLKAIVGNFGATELYKALNTLDSQLKRKEVPDTKALESIADEYEKVVRSIESFTASLQKPQSNADINTLNDDEAVETLRELADYLDKDIIRSLQLFKKLKGYNGRIINESDINTIESLFDIYDVDGIKEVIMQVLEDHTNIHGDNDE